MKGYLSDRWYVKLMGRVPAFIGWSVSVLLFITSLWSILGEYLYSAVAFVYMLCAFIDDYRKYGLKELRNTGPLGRNYFLFNFMALSISAIVNLVVYLRLLAQ